MGNAVNERSHETVNRLLRTFIERGFEDSWDEVISTVMMAMNTNINDSTRFMPFEALMGFKPRLPDDLIFGRLPEEDRTVPEEV